MNNIAYSKYSVAGDSTVSTASSLKKESTTAKTYAGPQGKDQDVVVLLPQRKNRAPRLKHKLSVNSCVTEVNRIVHIKFIFHKTFEFDVNNIKVTIKLLQFILFTILRLNTTLLINLLRVCSASFLCYLLSLCVFLLRYITCYYNKVHE